MFMVLKKNGSLRVAQDFRELNAASNDNRYLIKKVNECVGDTGRPASTIFTTLDLNPGICQLSIEEQSQLLTAFLIPGLGQFKWGVRPMSLLGCPASFQRLVELALADLVNIIVYIDDLLVH
jgi:hypothetical protein